MIQLIVNGNSLDLDSKARYRLELKLPLPGGDLEYSSTPFFDLPQTPHNLTSLKTSPVLSDTSRFRTYDSILRLAGMDLRCTLVVTTFSKTMRACLSMCSFGVDIEAPFNSVGHSEISCNTNSAFWNKEGYAPLPTIYNTDVYGSGGGDDGGGSNPGFGGLINWFDAATHKFFENEMPTTDEENDAGYNVYTRCPTPFFTPKFKEALGSSKNIDVGGTFFDDDDVNQLVMYSHALSDSVRNFEPDIYSTKSVYCHHGNYMSFNVMGDYTPFGFVGSACRVGSTGFLKMVCTVNTPDGEFEWVDPYAPSRDYRTLMPDDAPLSTHNDNGTTTIEWFGFLEMRKVEGLIIPERNLCLRQVSGSLFSSGSVTFVFHKIYQLNLQGDGKIYKERLMKRDDVLTPLSISEVLTNVSSMFCLVPLVHPSTGAVQINFMRDILQGKALDVSAIAGLEIEIEPQPPTVYKFSFDYPSDGYCGENSFKEIAGRPMIEVNSFFLAPPATADTFLIDKATLGVYSAEKNDDDELAWKWYTDLGGEETYGEGKEEVGITSKCTPMVNQIVTNPNGSKIMVPACKMEGISRYFKVNNRDTPLRLMHWCGWRNDTVGGKYPFATSGMRDINGNVIKSFELVWSGKHGLINTHWKAWLDFKKISEKVTIPLLPDDSKLPALISLFLPQEGKYDEQLRKIYCHDVEMLPLEMVVEFTQEGVTGVQVKALRSVCEGGINTYPSISIPS